MKKLILLMILIATLSLPALAQKAGKSMSRETMRKEITDFKIKYLAQEMKLNEEQQKKFSVLYRELSEERHELFHKVHSLKKNLKEGASDEAYEAYTKASVEAKEKEAEIAKKYDSKFSEFLTPKQQYEMKMAEERFNQKMQEMRKDKHKKK
ncbi:MAG: Spy/CpxP family protein refolding chaperone [Muribaculaceae bacterium]|nr:Spy/CpxP family protein refolding chaperone [Muribaculaceae bacterium]